MIKDVNYVIGDFRGKSDERPIRCWLVLLLIFSPCLSGRFLRDALKDLLEIFRAYVVNIEVYTYIVRGYAKRQNSLPVAKYGRFSFF